ncbi:mitochondrial protein [Ceratobasidium sp. AG-Ba]|nr:mitochondrial protein [Ceratobasidium sp. AG-Ba]QRW14519.1 mitochondrial protein [Ceratobasidium sp. AG-Ba]
MEGNKHKRDSSSGQPYRTPKGHTPAWANKVNFHKASALDPSTYRTLIEPCTAVVHTLGILLESPRYKPAVRSSSIGGLVSAFGHAWGLGAAGNPLTRPLPGEEGTYEQINTEAALKVLETYISFTSAAGPARPFVYISAEDIFRPLVPARYIESKRAAEAAITREGRVRGVYLRPGLMYHPHTRPLTTPVATLLDISANLHQKLLIPGPANLLRAFTSTKLARWLHPTGGTTSPDTPLESMARALETPPIHVEHVAQAACEAIARSDLSGPYGVRDMRGLIGWGGEVGAKTGLITRK